MCGRSGEVFEDYWNLQEGNLDFVAEKVWVCMKLDSVS